MNAASSTSLQSQVLGIIAGNGKLPILFAQAAREKGYKTVAVAMQGETRPDIEEAADKVHWIKIGQLRKMLRLFRKEGVTQAAMAGGVRKTRLYERLRPDWLTLKLLAQAWSRRDDGMLRLLAEECQRWGIEIVPSTLVLPKLLAPAGQITPLTATERQWIDLRLGFFIARRIGELDIGQTVVLKEGAVVALEAIEGTDACIERAKTLTKGRGAVMVKVAKPGQDFRFDLPTIGPVTIEKLADAGIQALGIHAEHTLLLESEHTIAAAQHHGICIIGMTDQDALDPTQSGLT